MLLFHAVIALCFDASNGKTVEAVVAKCEAEDNRDDTVYAASLLQMSMRMLPQQPQSSLLHSHHSMLASSDSQRLNSYESCDLSRFPSIQAVGSLPENVMLHNSSETAFYHIWKNGGSSVFQFFHSNSPGAISFTNAPTLNQSEWLKATIAREPLRRSVSAFHEAMQRTRCLPPFGKFSKPSLPTSDRVTCTEYDSNSSSGSEWIDLFKEQMSEVISGRKLRGDYMHMLPQMSFLVWGNGSKQDMDYIGSMDDNMTSAFNHMFDTRLEHLEEKGSISRRSSTFNIDPAQLPDDAIVLVCKAYHVDFCCFGYDFPDVCKSVGFSC